MFGSNGSTALSFLTSGSGCAGRFKPGSGVLRFVSLLEEEDAALLRRRSEPSALLDAPPRRFRGEEERAGETGARLSAALATSSRPSTSFGTSARAFR